MDKKTLLKNLCELADALALFFGRNCEIAIHDLSQLHSSLVHIAGSVTGRIVGAPATDLLLAHIEKYGDAAQNIPPYPTKTAEGHPMKSALTFIRDNRGRIIFALCMNYSISSHLNAIALLEEQVRMSGESCSEQSIETFASTLDETNDAIVKKVLQEFGKHPVDLNREEKISLVCKFQTAGAFNMKGMVERIAGILGISKYTLYSYRKLCTKK